MLIRTIRKKILYTEIMELCGFSETASKGILKIINKKDDKASGEWHSGGTDTEFYAGSIKQEYTEFNDIYSLAQTVFVKKKIKKDLSFERYMYLIHKYTYLEPYLCDDNKTVVCYTCYKNLEYSFRKKPLED